MERLQAPPIRTRLDDGPQRSEGGRNAASQTAKEWYFYWDRLGEQSNANTQKLDGLVTFGNHADRPDSSSLPPPPDGAIYFEEDRGSALYQYQDGEWVYVSGVMWGKLSPDERPTDLGAPNDIGFEFWAVDQSPVRKYIWNGSTWIEQTPVLYGTHAARLGLTAANVTPGVLYVETDRGNIIYEMQKPGGSNAWVYVAGVMSGTLSPDQRPGGLGANDTGFRFEASDTKQTFRWSGSAWVEVSTPQTPWKSDIDGAGFRLLNTGNVGIGTSSPGSPLTVNSNGYPQVLIRSASGEQSAALDFFSTGAGGRTHRILAGADGTFYVCYDLTAGASRVMVSTAGYVGIGTASPSYPLDVAGDVNCTGVYRVNGTPISGGGVTTQSNVTGSRAFSTNYQNTSGKPMFVSVSATTTSGQITAYSDSSVPPTSPTTQVAADGQSGGASVPIGLSFWVLPGNSYRVVNAGGTVTLQNWTEWT